MLSISTKVERIVTESPFLSEGLRRGLINLSELARQLQPQLQNDLWKPVGQAAVVMALRRVAERLPDRETQERTDLVEFTFRRSERIDDCHRQLLERAGTGHGLYLTVTRGSEEVVVICSRPFIGMVEQMFAGERLLARLENLNAVTLQLTADSWRTPGIYHAILKKLAWDKVNLINLISTHTELTLLLEKEHTGAAFSVLSNMIAHKH